MSLEDKTVAIVGLGLMGGAYADALKKLGPKWLIAYDRDEEVLEEALERELIDFGTSKIEKFPIGEADYVFVCLYPRAATDFILDNMNAFKAGVTVSDITGLKTPILEAVAPKLRPDIHFISGHPMAGSEKEGFGAADRMIFDNRNYVLVPLPDTDKSKLKQLKELITQMGFSNIVETTPAEHDEKIAFTSQLCHIIASALVDCEDDLSITDFEGGSFGDLTRIAMINAPMWTEIFIDNKDVLVGQIDQFERSLKKLRGQIVDGNKDDLEATLKSVRSKRVAMEVDRRNKHRS